MRSQAKSSSIKLPEEHEVEKGLDSNVIAEKQVMKPTVVTKVKEVSQIKPKLGQGRAGFRHAIKMPVPPPISIPIVQVMEIPVKQPKVPVPETSRMHDKVYHIMKFLI